MTAALNRLDPEYRALLELSYRRGIPDGEIAQLLGTTPDEIAGQLRTALGMLATSAWLDPLQDLPRVRGALMALPDGAWEAPERARRRGYGVLLAAALAAIAAAVVAAVLLLGPWRDDEPILSASREGASLGLSPGALSPAGEGRGDRFGGAAGDARGALEPGLASSPVDARGIASLADPLRGGGADQRGGRGDGDDKSSGGERSGGGGGSDDQSSGSSSGSTGSAGSAGSGGTDSSGGGQGAGDPRDEGDGPGDGGSDLEDGDGDPGGGVRTVAMEVPIQVTAAEAATQATARATRATEKAIPATGRPTPGEGEGEGDPGDGGEAPPEVDTGGDPGSGGGANP